MTRTKKWWVIQITKEVSTTATKIELKRYKIEKNASFFSGTKAVVSGTVKADIAENAILDLIEPCAIQRDYGVECQLQWRMPLKTRGHY